MLFVLFFISLQKTATMNVTDPQIQIIDIDGSNIMLYDRVVYLEKNGFLLCRQGSITLEMDSKEFEIREGELYIYPAFSQTVVVRYSDDLQAMIGAVDFDFSLSLINNVSNTQNLVYIRFHPVVRPTVGQYRRIEELIEITRRRQKSESVIGQHVVAALAQAACFEVLDTYISNSPIGQEKYTRKDKIFQQFLVDMHVNFRTHRSVGFYAGRSCLSPRYFATIIRERSGKTPVEWISMFVISEAKRRLSEPQASVKEIASALNFPNQSMFGRYFKLYAGMSPSVYRTSVQKSQITEKNGPRLIE